MTLISILGVMVSIHCTQYTLLPPWLQQLKPFCSLDERKDFGKLSIRRNNLNFVLGHVKASSFRLLSRVRPIMQITKTEKSYSNKKYL